MASCLICFVAGFLPSLRLRSVLRASCPSDAQGMNRHRELGCLGKFDYHSNFIPSIRCPRSSTRFLISPARAPPPLGGTRFTRRPCIALSSIISGQRERYSRTTRLRNPAETFRWHRAIGSQFQHHQQRKRSSASSVTRWNLHQVSVGLRPFYFGGGYFPAGSDRHYSVMAMQ